jgi:hypothetical protein
MDGGLRHAPLGTGGAKPAILPENLNLLKFLTFSPFARILHDCGFAVL